MKINLANIKKAEKLLIKRECVAIPTETVYGLAGNAYSNLACKKIYKLKNRPKNNPLIIHYYNLERLSKDCSVNSNFLKLYSKFCPGPITFILNKKKHSKIQSSVTANLNTVAIRFPAHKVVRSILKKINFPLAMPSANISSNVSPVTSKHVYNEFQNNLKIIIDGGNSKIGIESTVIDLTQKPKILRPGIIDANLIGKVLKRKIIVGKKSFKNKSPGMLNKHYSPGIPMFLNRKYKDSKHAFITFGKKFDNNKHSFNLSKNNDLNEAASNLYKILRKIKEDGYKKIFVVKIPNKGAGVAINDRLKRASQ